MLLPETRHIQTKLGDYCKTGILPDIPGINKKHVKHYRRLVFNVVKNNLFQAFPIVIDVIGKVKFVQLIDEFFSRHHAQTSQIWKLPGEFYEYAKTSDWVEKYNMPWLIDLLLLEWIEIKVHTMPDRTAPETQIQGDLFTSHLVINPDFEIIKLSYPVHLDPVRAAEQKKGDYFVLAFRNRDTGAVRFLNLSVLHAFLIENMVKEKHSLEKILQNSIDRFSIEDITQLKTAIKIFIKDLMDQRFILGFLKQ